MCDDAYIYRDQVQELQSINRFIKKNTLSSALHKAEWFKENGGSLMHMIEYLKYELKG